MFIMLNLLNVLHIIRILNMLKLYIYIYIYNILNSINVPPPRQGSLRAAELGAQQDRPLGQLDLQALRYYYYYYYYYYYHY